VDEMAADLLRSDLIVSPPDDLESMIDSYNTTLRALVDKHVPLRTKRSQERRSARWFDRKSKRLTRKLERRYRRVRTADAQAAWRQQFDTQRHLFQSKFTAFWLSTVESCQQNLRVLWRTVNTMLHLPRQHDICKLSAADLASFFRSKVANIRTATASANHRSLTHGRCHLSVSFSRRLLKNHSSHQHDARQVLFNSPYSYVALEASDSTRITCHLQAVQSLTTQWCFSYPIEAGFSPSDTEKE